MANNDFNIYNYLSNLSYINKDFNSIWEEIIDFVPKLTNKWKPGEANESDPLVVLLKELGILGDKLNYNIDKNTLEQFPDLLTQLRTAYSVFKSMGYNPNWYRSATTSISIIYNGATPSTSENTTLDNFTIPKFTQVSSEDYNQIYTLLEDVTFNIGTQTIKNSIAIEGTCNDFDVSGNTLITSNNLDSQNRLYFIQPNIAQNGIFISNAEENFKNIIIEDYTNTTIDSIGENTNINRNQINIWTRVDNLYQYLSGNKIFKFGIDPTSGSAYIQFPDDASTLIGNGIYIKYILSSGSQGNIASGTIDSFLNEPEFLGSTQDGNENIEAIFERSNFTLNNSITTQNGRDPETIEEMQKNYERVVGTFNTLVTLRDYENYIYNAENNIGQHIVSNIRVGDRSTDLYKSYKYVTQTVTGDIKQETHMGELGSQGSGLNAWDINLYPLNANDNINSYSDFSSTFNTISNTEGIQNNISKVKSLNHDISNEGYPPIFVDYTLKGQIYLQRSLSSTEAREVESNIQSAIYRNFNPRELNWGEPINYQKLVEVVKNSDSRIQYVAISPIEYKYNNNNNGSNYPVDDAKIKKLAILAGVTPWTQYSDFKYYYTKTDGTATMYPTSTNIITKIIPQSKFELVNGDEKTCKIQKNETLSILVPGYRTTTTYSNYFYAVFGSLKGDTLNGIPSEVPSEVPNKNFSIVLDTPYTLKANEYIAIYDTRDAAGDMLKSKATYLITPSTTVTISTTDSQYKNGFPSGTVVNMGSKTTISTIELDETIVRNPRAINDADENHQINIKTNSTSLINALRDKTKGFKINEEGKQDPVKGWEEKLIYTLNIGEYLLYSYWNTEENVTLEVGIIGEGNTLTFEKQPISPSSPDDYEKDGLITNSLDGLGNEIGGSANHAGIRIYSGSLSYIVNNIYSFGEGYKLTLDGKDSDKWDDDYIEGIKDLPTTVKTITYKYTNPGNSTTEGKLPGLGENDFYRYSYQLALVLTPGEAQELQSNQQVKLEYKNNTPTPTPTAIKGKTLIQSNITVIYSGGSGVEVDVPQSESEGGTKFELLVISGELEEDLNNDGSYFHNVPSNNEIKIPGDSTIAGFIIPVIVTNDNKTESVKYLLMQNTSSSSTEISIKNVNITKIGPPYAVMVNAQYFSGTAMANIVFNGIKMMDKDTYFYNVDKFCPIYRATGNELIEDPTNAESFFKPKHPLNRYVLPRLYSIDSKKSPLDELKIDDKSIRG